MNTHEHEPIKIEFDLSGNLGCKPKELRVRDEDEVRWTAPKDLEHWAVIFGPDSPFNDRILTPEVPKTKVNANRPGDFHRHKYVVLAWTDGQLSIGDPDLIVDE